MKKIICLLLIVLSLFCITSCKERITDDESAKKIFLEANTKAMEKRGSILTGDFALEFKFDGTPFFVSGGINMKNTTNPLGLDMDIDLVTSIFGFPMSMPIEFLMDESGFFMGIMNMWIDYSDLVPMYDVNDIDYKKIAIESKELLKDCITAKYNGVTEINDISVYDIDIKLTENAFYKIQDAMGGEYRKELEMALGPDEDLIVEMISNISFKTYLKEKDNSLYGIYIDMGEIFNNIMKISEVENIDFDGEISLFYAEGKPEKITVPEEVKEQAITLDEFANPFYMF